MRKLKVILTCLICMFIFSSCSENEIADTIYISSMSIIKNENSYETTLFGDDFTVSSSGKTLADSLNNAKISSGNNLFLGTLESISVNSLALRDTALLSAFTNSVVSPSCAIYYTESSVIPKSNANGYERKLSELAVCIRNDSPVIIPLANNHEKIAVITNGETIALNEEDSLGVMLLRGEVPERMITLLSKDEFKTFKISPKIKKSAKFQDKKLMINAEISLNSENADSESLGEISDRIKEICSESYKKLANTMGIDAFEISEIIGFKKDELCNSEISISVSS